MELCIEVVKSQGRRLTNGQDDLGGIELPGFEVDPDGLVG